MPNRIPTPGVKTPAVRKSPSAIAPAKPAMKAKPRVSPSAKGNPGKGNPGNAADTPGFRFGAGTV